MLRLIVVAVALSFAAPLHARPNIVLIYADDLGYADLGCFGGKIKTPNLDRVAAEGVRFTDFYVAQAVCSASRAALMTGKYSNRARIFGALGPGSKNGLVPGEKTIADLLKAVGYRTAIYGKWHLGHLAEHLPTRRGFDEYFGLPYSNDMWPKHPTAKFPDLPLIDYERTIAHNPDQTQLVTWYAERAVKFIEANKDRPFFLYLPHSMPHVPLFVSDRFKDKSGQGLYGDVIQEIDWSVGQILDTLKRLGLDDNTLVIFTSDNGPWLSYGHHAGSAGRLREGKGTAWDGGVRVPFVARWPGRIPADKTQNEPAMTIDLLPTLVHLAEAKLSENEIDGKNIKPLLFAEAGAKSPHDAYFFFWGKELHAVRSGQWKLHFPHHYRTMAGSTPGKDGQPGLYKDAVCGLELYDLRADVGESKNVIERNPEIAARLRGLAENIIADLGPEVAEFPKVKN